jgi:hypothetical protein
MLPYKCTLDTKTQYLQYRFIHRILPTNEFLYKIGLINTYTCTFCKEENETIKHLMWSRKFASKFWSSVIDWLEKLNIKITITYQQVCLGINHDKYSIFLNMIVLFIKRYIYKCRVQEIHPFFNDFKSWLLFTEKVEKSIAKNRNRYGYHIKKWEPFLQ